MRFASVRQVIVTFCCFSLFPLLIVAQTDIPNGVAAEDLTESGPALEEAVPSTGEETSEVPGAVVVTDEIQPGTGGMKPAPPAVELDPIIPADLLPVPPAVEISEELIPAEEDRAAEEVTEDLEILEPAEELTVDPFEVEIPEGFEAEAEDLEILEPAEELAVDQFEVEIPEGFEAEVEDLPAEEISVEDLMQPEVGEDVVGEVAPEPEPVRAYTPKAGFEIQREFKPREAAAVTPEAAAVVTAEPKVKRSFFGWLTGKKPEKPQVTQVTPVEVSEPEPVIDLEGLSPVERIAVEEELRLRAKEADALKEAELGHQAFARNEFEKALEHFSVAINGIPISPSSFNSRMKIKQKQAKCKHRMALLLYRDGNLNEAADACRQSLQYASNRDADRLLRRIDDELQRIMAQGDIEPPPTRPKPVKLDPDIVKKKATVRTALDRGREYMAIREYQRAKYEFRNVLITNAGNIEAAANLKKIAREEYKMASAQMERMKAEMITQVRETWTPPVRQDVTFVPKPIGPTHVMSKTRERLLRKLNEIIIPELNFREANIIDVVKYLVKQSAIGDKISPPNDKGVNIILNLGTAAGTAVVAPAPSMPEEDIFAPLDAEPFPDEPLAVGPAPGIPRITMSLKNLVLLDAIKFITEVTGLKYRIEDSAVMILSSTAPVPNVITRTYNVQPTIVDVIMSAAVGGVVDGADFRDAVAPQRGDVKAFFVETGVPFPPGTSIVYKQSINLLIVSNTPENLERFEKILATLNVVPRQVEIEALFIEVGQRELEELGVEWLLTDNWEIAQKAGPGPLSTRERLQINKGSFSKGVRFAAGSGAVAAGGTAGNILTFASVLTNPEVTFILHALRQMEGVNLLSAPKVTTKSGQNAEIKVVQELIYPTEFDQQVQSVGTGGTGDTPLTVVVVTPTAFETRDVGVVLNVTPVVAPDNFLIDLTMLPQVVELSDWINYGSTQYDAQGNAYTLNLPQPIFKSRSISTSVSIWDGQTIVMGGLITELSSTTEDKIPILGDIPFIGRFFRNKITVSEKRNLLIFVTARLVDPSGRKIPLATAAGVSEVIPATTP